MGLVTDVSCLSSRRDFAALCYDSPFWLSAGKERNTLMQRILLSVKANWGNR
jgi:hypothetical protein